MFARVMLRNFRFVHRVDRWYKRHTSRAGALLLGLMTTALLFGVDPRRTLAFQLFALCAAAALVGIAGCYGFRPRVTANRRLPRYATEGYPFAYTVELDNSGLPAQKGLQVRDYPAVTLPSLGDFVAAREPNNARRNWFDRKVGYPRWLYLTRRMRGAETAICDDVDLPADSSLSVRLLLTPTRRGRLRMAATALARPDPLGLFFAERRIANASETLVLPGRYPAPALTLPARGEARRRQARMESRLGHAETFISLRDYRPGDPPKHIHWKSWARVGEPVIKEFQEQHDPRYTLMLDNETTMPYDPVFESAVRIAASLASPLNGLPGNIDRILLTCRTVDALPQPAPAERLLEHLAVATPAGGFNAAAWQRPLLGNLDAMNGLVLIFLRLDEQRLTLLTALARAAMPMRVLLVQAGDETGDDAAPVPVLRIRVGSETPDLAALTGSNRG